MDYKKKLPQYLFARWEDRPSPPPHPPPFRILPKFLTIFHPPPPNTVCGVKSQIERGPKHTCVLAPPPAINTPG